MVPVWRAMASPKKTDLCPIAEPHSLQNLGIGEREKENERRQKKSGGEGGEMKRVRERGV